MQHANSSSSDIKRSRLSLLSLCQKHAPARKYLHRRLKPTLAPGGSWTVLCSNGSDARPYGAGNADGRGSSISAGASPAGADSPMGRAGGLPQIAVLSYNDRPEVTRAAVENIAAAFQDDPSTKFFCRPNRRIQYYRSVMSCLLDWYPREKQLVCTLPPDAAAIAYVYPRLRPLGPWAKLLRGGLAPLWCVRPERLMSGMDASDFFDSQREQFLQHHGPFLYVSVMAVRPGRQGCGLGSALLTFLCDRADAAGLPCYIEATSPRNKELYRRFGFELVKEWRASDQMPYTYILVRQPLSLDDGAAAVHAAAAVTHAANAATYAKPSVPAPGPYTADAASGGTTTAAPGGSSSACVSSSSACVSSSSACVSSDAPSTSGAGAGDVAGSGSPAGALPSGPTPQRTLQLQAAQQVQRRFVERRRRQLRARRSTATQARYVEYDEYDMWPLWMSGEPAVIAMAEQEEE